MPRQAAFVRELVASSLLHLWRGVLPKNARWLKYAGVLHDLRDPGETIGVGLAMGFGHAMINFVLECKQIVIRRRVAIETIKFDCIKEASSLVSQMCSVVCARQGGSGSRIARRSLGIVAAQQLPNIG